MEKRRVNKEIKMNQVKGRIRERERDGRIMRERECVVNRIYIPFDKCLKLK